VGGVREEQFRLYDDVVSGVDGLGGGTREIRTPEKWGGGRSGGGGVRKE
jgi:hypothetical protein